MDATTQNRPVWQACRWEIDRTISLDIEWLKINGISIVNMPEMSLRDYEERLVGDGSGPLPMLGYTTTVRAISSIRAELARRRVQTPTEPAAQAEITVSRHFEIVDDVWGYVIKINGVRLREMSLEQLVHAYERIWRLNDTSEENQIISAAIREEYFNRTQPPQRLPPRRTNVEGLYERFCLTQAEQDSTRTVGRTQIPATQRAYELPYNTDIYPICGVCKKVVDMVLLEEKSPSNKSKFRYVKVKCHGETAFVRHSSKMISAALVNSMRLPDVAMTPPKHVERERVAFGTHHRTLSI